MKLRLSYTAPTKDMIYIEIDINDKQIEKLRKARDEDLDLVSVEIFEEMAL